MAPLLSLISISNSIDLQAHNLLSKRSLNAKAEVRGQWRNPSDILSVLLLLGPDVIQLALAQLVGRRVTPVAFSFGWAAYSISALSSAIGDQRLMPHGDFRTSVIGANSGHIRENKSWIISRLLRDHELRAKPLVRDKNSPDWAALQVSVFKHVPQNSFGHPKLDWVWYSGFVVVLVQLIIACIPIPLSGDYIVITVTVCGTLVAFSHGTIPQWSQEKWNCPKRGGGTVTITQGNGSRRAIVILGGSEAPDLEVLAYCERNAAFAYSTRIVSGIQTALWLALLITVAGLKQGAWYLLTVGTIGMLQNLFAARFSRQPEAFGIHLDLVQTISDNRVSKVLARLEAEYPLVGTSLLPVFYPAGFQAPGESKEFWKVARQRRHKMISEISKDYLDEFSFLEETNGTLLGPVLAAPVDLSRLSEKS